MAIGSDLQQDAGIAEDDQSLQKKVDHCLRQPSSLCFKRS